MELSDSSRYISTAVTALLLYLVAQETSRQVARRRGSQLWFPVSTLLRVIYLFALIFFGGMAVWNASGVGMSGGPFVTFGFLAFSSLVVAIWPTAVGVDDQGVTEIRWGGLLCRRVPWKEVLHAVRIEIAQERKVQLILDRGKPITHSEMHVDRERFIREVSKHVEVFGGPPRVL